MFICVSIRLSTLAIIGIESYLFPKSESFRDFRETQTPKDALALQTPKEVKMTQTSVTESYFPNLFGIGITKHGNAYSGVAL